MKFQTEKLYFTTFIFKDEITPYRLFIYSSIVQNYSIKFLNYIFSKNGTLNKTIFFFSHCQLFMLCWTACDEVMDVSSIKKFVFYRQQIFRAS